MKTPKQSGHRKEDSTEQGTDKKRPIDQEKTDKTPPIDELDKPRTYKDAARALGLPYHVVQRAALHGLIPTYRLGTSRRYVKLRDILDYLERSTSGLTRDQGRRPPEQSELMPPAKASQGTDQLKND
jgi:hypothetical protein